MGIIDVDEIDTAKQNFTANVYLEARWHDSRLAHETDGEIAHPLDGVWHPRLQIVNQQRVIRTFPEIIEVSSNGPLTFILRKRVPADVLSSGKEPDEFGRLNRADLSLANAATGQISVV